MSDLTIVTLCQALANITHNRCHLVENSNTCRCVEEIMGSKTTNILSTAPEIMMSEVVLIFFVLAIWLSAIGFCLNQYKSLRRLETQVHYCVNRKDPLNIGEIKIVAREQDSIIYKKKRYSTVLDTHIDNDELKAMHYIQEYLPKHLKTPSSSITALVVGRDDLTATVPLSTTTPSLYHSPNSFSSAQYTPLAAHSELPEEQHLSMEQEPFSAPPSSLTSFALFDTDTRRPNGRLSYAHRTESGRLSTGLTVPPSLHPSGSRLSWNGSTLYETSRSAQHLAVPSNSLRSNRYSDGNISLPVPPNAQTTSDKPNEQLIDPRLISNAVRRSLLALHRESQESIFFQRTKEKTQSENDVHGSFTPWKIKMKAKLKRTHHHHHQNQQQQSSPRPQATIRQHSKTVSILPARDNGNDQERRISEYATKNAEYRFSTPPSRNPLSVNPTLRRSLKHYPKYSTQSTTESESTQGDIPMITSICVSPDEEQSTRTIHENDAQAPLTTL